MPRTIDHRQLPRVRRPARSAAVRRRRLAFEPLEAREMFATLTNSFDAVVGLDDEPATSVEAACERGPAPALDWEHPLLADEYGFVAENPSWFDIESPPATDAACEPGLIDAIPAPDAFIMPVEDALLVVDDAAWVVIDEPWFFDDAAADGWYEPMAVAVEQAGVDQEAELPDPGTDDGRQMVFATRAADVPAPTARGPSATAIRHHMAAAFGFSLPAADGDAFWTGFGIGTAKRRTR